MPTRVVRNVVVVKLVRRSRTGVNRKQDRQAPGPD